MQLPGLSRSPQNRSVPGAESRFKNVPRFAIKRTKFSHYVCLLLLVVVTRISSGTKCRSALEASHVECLDYSSTSSCEGGAKLDLVVVTDKFAGVPLLKRHRMVNDCLSDLMPRIHAITMKTWTVEQYQNQKNKSDSSS